MAYGVVGLSPEAFWRITPCEWSLLADGRAAHREDQDRRIARWLSPLLSATAGQVITPAELLGEEPAKDSPKKLAAEVRDAEKRLAARLRKIQRAKKKGKSHA